MAERRLGQKVAAQLRTQLRDRAALEDLRRRGAVVVGNVLHEGPYVTIQWQPRRGGKPRPAGQEVSCGDG